MVKVKSLGIPTADSLTKRNEPIRAQAQTQRATADVIGKLQKQQLSCRSVREDTCELCSSERYLCNLCTV